MPRFSLQLTIAKVGKQLSTVEVRFSDRPWGMEIMTTVGAYWILILYEYYCYTVTSTNPNPQP